MVSHLANATVCLPLYLSDLPPFHSISAFLPPSVLPSLPPPLICSAAIVSHETFLMEQVSFGVRRTSPTRPVLDRSYFQPTVILNQQLFSWIGAGLQKKDTGNFFYIIS